MPEPSAAIATTGPLGSAAQVQSPAAAAAPKSASMSRFILDLIRPYRGWLTIVFAAMMVETPMSLAAPWPLKIDPRQRASARHAAALARLVHDLPVATRHDGARAVRRRWPRS